MSKDKGRKCWASTTDETCIAPDACDAAGCQLYADPAPESTPPAERGHAIGKMEITKEQIMAASRIRAEELVNNLGDALIGKHVLTMPLGSWPGGEAIVTELHHDAGAPEIVFIVKGDDPKITAAVDAGELPDNEIGVFDYEWVVML